MKEHIITEEFLEFLFLLAKQKSMNAAVVTIIRYLAVHGRIPSDPGQVNCLIRLRKEDITRGFNKLLKHNIIFEDDGGYIMPHIKTFVDGEILNPLKLLSPEALNILEKPEDIAKRMTKFEDNLTNYENKREALESVIKAGYEEVLALYRKKIRKNYLPSEAEEGMIRYAVGDSGKQKCCQAVLGLAVALKSDPIARHNQRDDIIKDCLYSKEIINYRVEQFKRKLAQKRQKN